MTIVQAFHRHVNKILFRETSNAIIRQPILSGTILFGMSCALRDTLPAPCDTSRAIRDTRSTLCDMGCAIRDTRGTVQVWATGKTCAKYVTI